MIGTFYMYQSAIWELGSSGDFAPDPRAKYPWFQMPHALERLPNGNFIMYDNGKLARGFSRAVEYAIDRKTYAEVLSYGYNEPVNQIAASDAYGYNPTIKPIFRKKIQLNNYQLIDPDDFIWKEYLQSKLPILIVPGDHFLFYVHSNEFNRDFAIRDMAINSMEDLQEFNSQYQNTIVNPSLEPYFPYHSVWSLPPILALLNASNQESSLRESSDITPEVLNLYNIRFNLDYTKAYLL